MKAFSFFLLLFALASTQGFAQATTPASAQEQSVKEQHSDSQTLEASISPREQAERDLLVPRKYQEQLAAEAAKPIKYGPSNASGKKYYRSSSRKKYYSKRRSSSRRR